MTESDHTNDGTVQGLIEYCDFLIEKGYASASAVNPWKSAAKQVFSTVEDSDEYGGLDVRDLDLDEYMSRFETKVLGKLKQESVTSYRQRVRKALDSYRNYLADPAGWRPPVLRQVRAAAKGREGRSKTSEKVTPINIGSNGEGNGNGASLIDYPFPLQSGQLAHVRLPRELRKADAERLAAFVRTLVFEPARQIPEKTGEQDEEAA